VPRSSQPLRVVLSLSVSETGEVTSVKVVSGQGPELDAEARRLALTIDFEPARRGDRAVPMTIPWTVTFK
jgi:TonB family protein